MTSRRTSAWEAIFNIAIESHLKYNSADNPILLVNEFSYFFAHKTEAVLGTTKSLNFSQISS